jgi:hypothetical protein
LKRMVNLILGDCLEKMKEMESNSVDSIVTDPPYGISFMNKKWDYDIPSVEIWNECLRVLKPGGHLLSFGGSRTFHRICVNIEDAGFEIRDTIMWLYGSGFPKSHNIGKAIDKRGGNNVLNNEIAEKLKEARTKRNITLKQADEMFCNGTTNYSWYEGRPKGIRIPEPEEFQKIVDAWPEMKEYFDKTFPANRPVIDVINKARNFDSSYAIPGLGSETTYVDLEITEASTNEAKQWDGWGTALKPAHEPIIMARKPFKGDVATNVLKYGTGAVNIDACRVGNEVISTHNAPKGTFAGGDENRGSDTSSYKEHTGRWPANIIHDGSEDVVSLFPNTKSSSGSFKASDYEEKETSTPFTRGDFEGYGDSGSAARFFYCAKANKKDRNEGCESLEEKNHMRVNAPRNNEDKKYSTKYNNHHPTVKPTELMKYLCRLITPKEGIILDPFMGSGSTGKAAILEGFSFIGIEMDESYLEIAKARIDYVLWEENEE